MIFRKNHKVETKSPLHLHLHGIKRKQTPINKNEKKSIEKIKSRLTHNCVNTRAQVHNDDVLNFPERQRRR